MYSRIMYNMDSKMFKNITNFTFNQHNYFLSCKMFYPLQYFKHLLLRLRLFLGLIVSIYSQNYINFTSKK